MRPVSAAFMRSLSGTHKAIVRATICNTFQTGTQPTGTQVGVVDGTVTLDAKSDVRGSLDITLNVAWPRRAIDLAAPYGNEIYVERGIEYDVGNVEYVGLGYFRINDDDNESDTLDADVMRVTGFDRMKAIVEGRLLQPRQFVVGTTFGDMVEELVTDIYPDAIIEWDDTANLEVLVRSLIVDDDRYGFLNDAITSLSKIWYWDHRGVLVIKNVPDENMPPVADISHGVGGVLVNLNRTLTRDGTYNAVVALGESTDTEEPVRGFAIDEDPNSPTYFYGRFGQVPIFFSSQFLLTTAQCTDTATSLLRRQLGLTYRVNFGSIVNPALDPYDVVTVKHSHNEARQKHVLDTLNIPLGIGQPLTSETRERRVTLVT